MNLTCPHGLDLRSLATELHNYLERILNPNDFSLSNALTVDMLENGLRAKQPMQINFAGYQVALLMGQGEVIQSNTSRFIYAGLLEHFLRDYEQNGNG